MTTQEAINLVVNDPRIKQEREALKANEARYQSDKSYLRQQIDTAQAEYDKIYQQLNNPTGPITQDLTKQYQQALENLNKAKTAYSDSMAKWGPAYTGVSGGLTSWGVRIPAGETLTSSQKQVQNPLYNPLYDPSSPEYSSNLRNISNPKQTGAVIQNPLAKNQGTQVKPINVNSSNLIQAVQSQNQPVSNPTIQLPDIFKQNQNTSPSIYPPNTPQGIKMPNFTRNSGSNSNWADLFSVANNRYTR